MRVASPSGLPRLFCLVSSRDDLGLLPTFVEAGVDGFQVRDKEATTRELIALASQVRSLVGDVCVVVDDRLDVALAAGADGVHLGADDLPVDVARRLAPNLLIGATCRSGAALAAARSAGADYAGFGPIQASGSKIGLPDPLGVEALSSAVTIEPALPLIAIGGIDARAARAAKVAGAHGVAVIGSIWRDPDPVNAAKELVAAVA